MAQTEHTAVRGVVERVFGGMRQGDTALVRSLFLPGARLVTAVPGARAESVDEFVTAIAAARARGLDLDERLVEVEVRVDDRLASVWARYELWVNGQFSHCGVDAFHLVNADSVWRISEIADTRRREGCAPAKPESSDRQGPGTGRRQ